MKSRSKKGYRQIKCSKCDEPAREGGRYCKYHHAEDMRLARLAKKINEQNGNTGITK